MKQTTSRSSSKEDVFLTSPQAVKKSLQQELATSKTEDMQHKDATEFVD